jgi:hypothetical protein
MFKLPIVKLEIDNHNKHVICTLVDFQILKNTAKKNVINVYYYNFLFS